MKRALRIQVVVPGLLTAIACLTAISGLGGCYRHVVEVKGPGSAAYDIYEPNFKPEEEQQIEAWFGSIFGAKPDESKRRK